VLKHALDGATTGTAVVGAGVGEGVHGKVGAGVTFMGAGVGTGVHGAVGKAVWFVGAGVAAQTHVQRWTARLADVSTHRVPLEWSQDPSVPIALMQCFSWLPHRVNDPTN
jgi:hypothetical protein